MRIEPIAPPCRSQIVSTPQLSRRPPNVRPERLIAQVSPTVHNIPRPPVSITRPPPLLTRIRQSIGPILPNVSFRAPIANGGADAAGGFQDGQGASGGNSSSGREHVAPNVGIDALNVPIHAADAIADSFSTVGLHRERQTPQPALPVLGNTASSSNSLTHH